MNFYVDANEDRAAYRQNGMSAAEGVFVMKLGRLLHEPEIGVRRSAIDALKMVGAGSVRVQNDLHDALRDSDLLVRAKAACVLYDATLKPEPSLTVLCELATIGDEDSQIEALFGIRQMGATAQSAMPLLEQLSRESGSLVREAATRVLEEVRRK